MSPSLCEIIVVVLGRMAESRQAVLTPPLLVAVTPSAVVIVIVAKTVEEQELILSWTTNLFAAGRAPDRGTATGPRAAGNVGQDENAGGATPRLPEAHRRAQGVSLRQGRAL